MPRRILLLLLGLCLAGPEAIRAQPNRLAALPGLRVETLLERDLNRYRYVAALALGVQEGPWAIDGRQRLTSDAFEIFGGRLTFRDELDARLRAVRTFSPRVQVGVVTRARAYSQSRVLSSETMGLAVVQASPRLTVDVEAGVALDQRPGVAVPGGAAPLRTDVGPGAMARATFTEASDVLSVDVQGRAGWTLLTPRQAGDLGLRVAAERVFDATRLGVEVLGSRLRRDAYQAASFLNRTDVRPDETVEATTSDTLYAAFTLETPVLGPLRHTSGLDVQANARRVRTLRAEPDALYFDTDFTRQAVAYDGALLAEAGGALVRWAVQVGAETERRILVNRDGLPPVQAAQKRALLRQADFDRGLLATSLTLRGGRGRLRVFADGVVSILRHDTPDTNPDDRDEAQQTGSVGVQWQVRPALVVNTALFASSYHTVYLKRERSGENSRQRSLRLRPTLTWRPAPLSRVEVTSEVRATYTVADRVLEGRTGADQSARELRHTVDVEHAFHPTLRVQARGTRSDLRLGRLARGRFAEIPYDTLRTYALDARVQLVGRMTAEVGVRVFARRDSERSLTVRYARVGEDGMPLRHADGEVVIATISRPGRTWRRQIGPVVRLSWPLGGTSALTLDGWYAVQTLSSVLFGALPPSDADRIRSAARHGPRDVFPNVSIAVRWQVW